MSPKSASETVFFRLFSQDLPNTTALSKLIRSSCPGDYLQADIFTYGGKCLVIAYTQPPKAICRQTASLRLKR